MDQILEYSWVLWLALIILFIAVEASTVQLVSIWFSGASLITMIVALCGASIFVQLIVFVAASAILLLGSQPLVKKYFKKNESKTNVDSIIGEVCYVTKDVNPDDRGEVKVRGQFWLAVSSENTKIEAGKKVSILAIEGNKLIVKELE